MNCLPDDIITAVRVRFADQSERDFQVTRRPDFVSPDKGIISNQSPLGQAILDKSPGTKVSYRVGPKHIEVHIIAVVNLG